MTPPILVQLKCPKCATTHWTIDSDYRGTDGVFVDYSERVYQCPTCAYSEVGYTVLQKSPPHFLLQLHPMYPMRQEEFDYWAEILKSEFPDHPMTTQLGKEFRPNSQIFLTELRNRWFAWKHKVNRRIVIIGVDIEDWFHQKLPKRPANSPRRRALTPHPPITRDSNSVSIFVSYSHSPDDSRFVFKLVDYVRRSLGKMKRDVEHVGDSTVPTYRRAVEIWCSRLATTGNSWQDELDDREFQSANYILLLLSPDYLASDYCRRQMNEAERREQMGSAKVIPVILSPVEFQPPAQWRLLPANGQPVANWPNRDDAFTEITEGILQAIPAEVKEGWVDDPETRGEYITLS
jgi:TIR domain-containing protein